jgi:hypothetical protein
MSRYPAYCAKSYFFPFLTLILTIWSVDVAAAPMAFRLASDGGPMGHSWIVADGDIASDTPDRFREFLQARNVRRGTRLEVYLNSTGGNLFGGVLLGELIREYGFGTRVASSVPRNGGLPSLFEVGAPGDCLSACSFAFLGGKWRIAADGSLGVHQHFIVEALADPRTKRFNVEDFSTLQVVNGLLTDYVVRMGVDARFLALAEETPPSEVYRFAADELVRYAITWDDNEYMDWTLEPYRDGLIAVSRTRNEEHSATLYCRNDRILRLMLNMPRRMERVAANDIVEGAKVFVFGQEIRKQDVQTAADDERLRFDIRLPASLKPDDNGIGAMGSTRLLFYQRIPARHFDVMSNVVSRNCSLYLQ